MRKKIISVLFGILLCQNLTTAEEQKFYENNTPLYKTAYNTNAYYTSQYNKHVLNQNFDSINTFAHKEFHASTLEKGSKFYVKSLQPMSSSTPEGARIDFETNTNILYPDKISHVIFTGKVVESRPPRFAGRSSTIKLEIFKVKVDNVTYPAKAYISRMGKKAVVGNVLSGMPIYLNNLATTADQGTVTINKIYKDPCQYKCETIKAPLRTGYYLGGAFLQLADLCVAPIICLFQKGTEINIPKDSSFEIKLANDMSLLKL